MSYTSSESSEEDDSLLGRMRACLGDHGYREDYLVTVIGELCVKLNYRGSGEYRQMGKAEVHRRWNSFTHEGQNNSDEEEQIIDELDNEIAKLENTKSSLLGQVRAERARPNQWRDCYEAEVRKITQWRDSYEEEVRKNEAKNVQIFNLERKKSAFEKTSSDHASKVQRLSRDAGEKDSKIRTLQASVLSRANRVTSLESDAQIKDRRITSLQLQVKNTEETATAQDNKIKELRGLRFSKDEQITNLKRDFDTLLTKTTEFDKDQRSKITEQQATIQELEANIKQIEMYRPPIESTCRLIQMAYRQLEIGKPSTEQLLLEQQNAIDNVDTENVATRDLTQQLQDQGTQTCLLEWEIQEQKNKVKDLEQILAEKAGELEGKDEEITTLFVLLTECMSGRRVIKGRCMSF